MDSQVLAKKIAAAAAELKALDIKILDLRQLSSFTDFFVVCSGGSDRQLRAIADRVIEETKKEGLRPTSKEGYEQGEWVLVDYSDVVLHIFTEAARAHYDLEGFWNRAPALGSREKKPRARKAPPKGKRPAARKPTRPRKAAPKKAKTSAKKKKK